MNHLEALRFSENIRQKAELQLNEPTNVGTDLVGPCSRLDAFEDLAFYVV